VKIKQTIIIEGGFWGQLKINAGEHLRISCPDGPQVADFWAFDANDMSTFFSTEHTRSTLEKLVPSVGDKLYSNFRYPMLTIIEDTSAGNHDMLMSACDPRRYELLDHEGYHRSCAENFCLAMDDAGMTVNELPSPLNIFQNVTIHEDKSTSIVPPYFITGQHLEMRAETELQIVVSACPMDIAFTNGPDRKSKKILLETLSKM
jgi:uncharacterized protein YcgI (DUF1989 family)